MSLKCDTGLWTPECNRRLAVGSCCCQGSFLSSTWLLWSIGYVGRDLCFLCWITSEFTEGYETGERGSLNGPLPLWAISMVWCLCPPRVPSAEILTPQMMVCEGGVLKRCLWVEFSWMGLIPYRKASESSLTSFHHRQTQWEGAISETESGPSLVRQPVDILVLNFPNSKEVWEINFCGLSDTQYMLFGDAVWADEDSRQTQENGEGSRHNVYTLDNRKMQTPSSQPLCFLGDGEGIGLSKLDLF